MAIKSVLLKGSELFLQPGYYYDWFKQQNNTSKAF